MSLPLANYFIVIIFSISLATFKCQQNETNSSQTVVSQPEAVQTSSNSANDGNQELNDPFLRIMNASSIEEVLELGLLYKGNRLATAADLGAVVDPNTHQLMVSGGHGFAVPDACNPREVTVEIQVENLSPTSRLFPKCVKVTRCGGCCGTNDVICKPVYIENKLYNLVELSMVGPNGISVVGKFPVELEQHLSCRCECTLSEEKCGPLKTFDSTACACYCNDQSVRCSPPKRFSGETCGCVCAEERDCCPLGNFCGRYFNPNTCDCEIPRRGASIDGSNLNQSDINWYINNHLNAAPQTTTTTTTTTTTPPPPPPTTIPTTRRPCGNQRCPPNFRLVPRPGGRCRCFPNL